MSKMLKINCNTAIEAATLKDLLDEQGIECQICDETNSKVARGLITDRSVDVMVREEDIEQARSIYNRLCKEQAGRQVTWCPKCGSENIQTTVQYRRFGNWTSLILGLAFLGMGIYILVQNLDQSLYEIISNSALLIIIGGGLIVYWFCSSASRHNHICRDCKHRF